MTAKPVRDLLFSKTRNQQQNLPIPIGTIRQIEIETPSSSPKVESETKSSTEMKNLMILKQQLKSCNKVLKKFVLFQIELKTHICSNAISFKITLMFL